MANSEEDDGSEWQTVGAKPKLGPKRKADFDKDFHKSAKVSKKNLYKPPTNAELNTLKESEKLFQSSLFRLQLKGLISEIEVKDKWCQQAKDYTEKLIHRIKNINSFQEYELSNQDWLDKKKVKVPILQKPFPLKGKFKFLTPKKVVEIGSFGTSLCVKPEPKVDLAIVMPKECIQIKDYLNQRYLRKRALYLACVASALNTWKEQSGLWFTYLHGNHTKPVLEVKPSGKLGSHVTIHLHVVMESDSFKLNRFNINKSNVRKQWFFQRTDDAMEEEDDVCPTPHYNTCVLQDLTMELNNELLQTSVKGAVGLQRGVALLKTWLHQRQLDVGFGGFSGYVLTMYVVYLVVTKELSTMSSAYQVLRNTLTYLSHADWTNKGISLCSNSEAQHPTLEEFHEKFPVVFVDVSGFTNICCDMSRNTFERVKHEAQLAVQWIEDPTVDSFEALFMKQVPFMKKFDQVIHVSELSNLENVCSMLGDEDKVVDYCGDYVHGCLNALQDLLHQCIGRRVAFLDRRLTPPPKWGVSDSPPDFDAQEKLTFGVLLNPDTCNSVIDKSPPADTLEAGKFRSFWGELSELRRFQDGGICEAVLWPTKTEADRRQILGKIVKHILNRHCDIPRDTVTVLGGQLDGLLRLPLQKKRKNVVCGTGEELHLEVIRVHDELCKQIRQLRNLPLAINSVQGVSSVFRYTQVFPPMKASFTCRVKQQETFSYPSPDWPAPPYTAPISVLCMLEGSGKWPEDLEAVRRIKAAYLLKLGHLLQSVHGLVTCPTPTHLYVYKSGYVFKLEVGCTREIGLAKLTKTPEGMVKTSHTAESLRLEQKLVTVPKLTSTLHGIQEQFGSFCGSVCLAKRWVSAHMLLEDHVPEEAVELIVAYLYLSPAPFTVPGSPLVGFVRFLSLLSSWDWKQQPLLVNLNSQFTMEERTEIHNKFTSERNTLPLMFIATPGDKVSSQWTKVQPSAPVLNRLVLLAAECLPILETRLEDTRINVDFKTIFRPPLETFDVLIHLKREHVSRRHQAVDVSKDTVVPDYKDDVAEKSLNDRLPVVGYDPVNSYLRDLRESFDDLALFFCDKYGGSVIGVLWKPHAFSEKPFNLMDTAARKPSSTNDGVKLVLNREAILSDFECIGEGLVDRVEANR